VVPGRGDDDCHATLLGGREKIFAYLPDELLLVPVEHNDMVAAASIEDLGPGSHSIPRPGANRNPGLILRGSRAHPLGRIPHRESGYSQLLGV
jgi:hypothetical protein